MPLVKQVLAAALLGGSCAAAFGQTLRIGGSPLIIEAAPDGVIGVLRNEGGVEVPQFYGTSSKGSALLVDGPDGRIRRACGAGTFALWDDAAEQFVPVTHTRPDAGRIVTVLDAVAGQLRIEQTLTYTDGYPDYGLQWRISNTGSVPFANLVFVHGGDVTPYGSDMASGFWSAESNLVGVVVAPDPRFMGLRGDAATPAVTHMAGHFELVREAGKAGLPAGSVDSAALDAAYALAWTRAQLAPGETWLIRAREVWTGVAPPAVQFGDVTAALRQPMLAWKLNRQTGMYDGTLTLVSDSAVLTPPFWLVLDPTDARRFVTPTGRTPDQKEYVDLSAAVTARAGPELQPGETATVTGFSVYIRTRELPPATAFHIRANSGGGTPAE